MLPDLQPCPCLWSRKQLTVDRWFNSCLVRHGGLVVSLCLSGDSCECVRMGALPLRNLRAIPMRRKLNCLSQHPAEKSLAVEDLMRAFYKCLQVCLLVSTVPDPKQPQPTKERIKEHQTSCQTSCQTSKKTQPTSTNQARNQAANNRPNMTKQTGKTQAGTSLNILELDQFHHLSITFAVGYISGGVPYEKVWKQVKALSHSRRLPPGPSCHTFRPPRHHSSVNHAESCHGLDRLNLSAQQYSKNQCSTNCGKHNLRGDSGLTRYNAHLCIGFWSYSLFLLLTLFLPTLHNVTYIQ